MNNPFIGHLLLAPTVDDVFDATNLGDGANASVSRERKHAINNNRGFDMMVLFERELWVEEDLMVA